MTTLISVLLVLSIVVPFGIYFKSEKSKKSGKIALLSNIFSFFSILVVSTVCVFASASAAPADASNTAGLAYIAAALVTGMATIGAGIAVASASSAALGAFSEDPKVMGKALIFVALAEGIALYGLLIAFMIIGRL